MIRCSRDRTPMVEPFSPVPTALFPRPSLIEIPPWANRQLLRNLGHVSERRSMRSGLSQSSGCGRRSQLRYQQSRLVTADSADAHLCSTGRDPVISESRRRKATPRKEGRLLGRPHGCQREAVQGDGRSVTVLAPVAYSCHVPRPAVMAEWLRAPRKLLRPSGSGRPPSIASRFDPLRPEN